MNYELRRSKKYMSNFYYGIFTEYEYDHNTLQVSGIPSVSFEGLKLYVNVKNYFAMDIIDVEWARHPFMVPTVKPRRVPKIITKFLTSNQWVLYINQGKLRVSLKDIS